jgi:hypothetical protein
MRIDHHLDISEIEVPRFAVEAQERIGKLFTLATLVWNVLETKGSVEIVFHGLNREDPGRRIAAFKEIMSSLNAASTPSFEDGPEGHVGEHYQWLLVASTKPGG